MSKKIEEELGIKKPHELSKYRYFEVWCGRFWPLALLVGALFGSLDFTAISFSILFVLGVGLMIIDLAGAFRNWRKRSNDATQNTAYLK